MKTDLGLSTTCFVCNTIVMMIIIIIITTNVYRAIDHCYTDPMADNSVYNIIMYISLANIGSCPSRRGCVLLLYYIYFIFCIYLFSRHDNIIITVSVSRSEYTCVLYIIISYNIINYNLHLCVRRIGTMYTLNDDFLRLIIYNCSRVNKSI